ncbi:hypothetical protein GCM10009853_016470 [Glycomyces scopariae]|uniref:DUF4267 domain-containing protein n=1 Tax=Glycomyces sambucus TaxID=380244 RepID=A0A1G9I4J1_9ACTN|nr:DUF4267 domain-containing protein [Glycomyces sambucus]SDL19733.1 protein of unknown function [Glycomyces sambucus]
MDLTTLTMWAAAALGAGFALLGVTGVLAPEFAARAYGVPADTPGTRSWAAAAAWRDVAAGAAVLVVASTSTPAVTGVVLFALALIPFGDMVTVARHGVRDGSAYLPHLAGFAATAAVGAVLVAL